MARYGAGRMRHPVRLQEQQGATLNAARETIPSWVDVVRQAGEVTELSGSEQWHAKHVEAGCTHMVRIRHRLGLTPVHRLVWEDVGGERTLNIRYITSDERKEWSFVFCNEQVDVTATIDPR